MFKRNTDTPVPATVKPPMVGGGAAMMLKSMGIDPGQMEALAEAFLTDVSDMSKRVTAIETRLTVIETQQAEILAALHRIAPQVA